MQKQNVRKVGNQHRSKSHDRVVKCEKCGASFAVSNNSPVDYVPQHECHRKGNEETREEKHDHDVCRDVQMAVGFLLVADTLEDILRIYRKLRSEMGSLVILNLTLAVYIIAMMFLLVNHK